MVRAHFEQVKNSGFYSNHNTLKCRAFVVTAITAVVAVIVSAIVVILHVVRVLESSA
jgi:hypothetical protein